LIVSYDWKNLKWREVIWFAVVPVGLAAFFLKAYLITGDPFAPLTAHYAWDKHLAWPWQTFLDPSYQNRAFLLVERGLALSYLAMVPVMVKRLPRGYWLFGLLAMIPILISGNLMGFSRHLVTNFPFILSVALVSGRRPSYFLAVLVASAVLLGMIMMAYSQFYAIW
ncbi:MAG TPA: hypothetical protein VI688_01760, partial [Anaerolineales bacterium]|nr:hypothetical protein [Anaerolineales bacterium]